MTSSIANVGCSVDGLKDRYKISGDEELYGHTIYLADVVLPSAHGEHFLNGEHAEVSRIASGLPWPPESRISLDRKTGLRRIPVALAWHTIINSESLDPRWQVNPNHSISLARVIASHISHVLSKAPGASLLALAIPNDLNEFCQEAIKRALRTTSLAKNFPEVAFVWRPVAAALSWLNEVGDLPPFENDDYIIVAHLGPDAIEIVPLELRRKLNPSTGSQIIVPLRRIEEPIRKCGCNWASSLLEQQFTDLDDAAFWQAFTGFPELWRMLCDAGFNQNELPRIWYKGNVWDLWNPSAELGQGKWESHLLGDDRIYKIATCRGHRELSCTWRQFLDSKFSAILDRYKSCRLLGVVASGPISCRDLSWIRDALGNRNIHFPISERAKVEEIWSPGLERDLVAEGTQTYADRFQRQEPTYLDVLAPFEILAQAKSKNLWVDLIEEHEVLGGKTYEHAGKTNFRLKRGMKSLDVYLRRGEASDVRKAEFAFPYAPSVETPVAPVIRVKSAGGLAQLELIPSPKEFLGGDRVFLDYSTMQLATELPELKLAYPPVDDYPVLPFKEVRDNRYYYSLETYLKSDTNRNLIIKIRPLVTCNPRGRLVNKEGRTGNADGDKLAQAISDRLGRDIEFAASKSDGETIKEVLKTSRWLFGGAPESVKEYVKKYLSRVQNARHRAIVDTAGYVLTDAAGYQVYFSEFEKRIIQSPYPDRLPNYWLKGLMLLLRYREDAAKSLSPKQAKLFTVYALRRMGLEAKMGRFKLNFITFAMPLLYLLRYRIVDDDFLDPDSPRDAAIFKDCITCLEAAEKAALTSSKSNSRTLEQISFVLKGIRDFMHKEGSILVVEGIKEAEGEDTERSDQDDD